MQLAGEQFNWLQVKFRLQQWNARLREGAVKLHACLLMSCLG